MTVRLAADIILWGGKVLAVDPGFTIAEAVAVAGDRIVAVGGNGEVKRLAGDGTRMIDLPGATVVPGMIDNHTHMLLAGLDHPEACGVTGTRDMGWLREGIVVTGGTDCPAVHYDLERPLLGLYQACTQETLVGKLLPEETIGREDALRLWTINGAYATFQEPLEGSLEPGKLADLAVLDRDDLEVPDEDLPRIQVSTTMVGGRIVHERG